MLGVPFFKKQRALVVHRISKISLPLLLVAKWVCCRDIYYIDSDVTDCNRIRELEHRGIKWIKREYSDYSQHMRGMSLATVYADEIYSKVSGSSILCLINSFLNVTDEQKDKMEVLWKYHFFRAIIPFADQRAASVFLRDKGIYDSVCMIAFSSLAFLLGKESEDGIHVRRFPGYPYSRSVKTVLRHFLLKVGSRLVNCFKGQRKRGRIVTGVASSSKPSGTQKARVIYFPHQGILYGDLYVKDHYHSDNSESPFHRSRMLHVSLGEIGMPHMRESIEYYRKNDIPFLDINDIGYDKVRLARDVFALLRGYGFNVLTDLARGGLFFVALSILLFANLRKYCLIFSSLSSAKIALLGYEFNFPRTISMALSLLGVKVCATQERFIQAFLPDTYYILDYYFVTGKRVFEKGLKNCHIDHCIALGMVREDNLFYHEKSHSWDEKYDRIKKEKKLILVLDYHPPKDELEDISRSVGKNSQLRRFYKDIITLASDFPGVHIVVKGKEAKSYDNPFIADIVETIAHTANIEIEFDLKRYDPYYISEKADLTIACHTSLCDELIAADRGVIIYELSDYLETIFDYDGLPIVVRDYERLRHNVNNFFQGSYLEQEKRVKMRTDFYTNCYHGGVRRSLEGILEHINDGLGK